MGETYNDKLQKEMRQHVFEEKNKLFGYTPRILESALVTAHDTEKNPELTGVGCSPVLKNKDGKMVADLLTNNFGVWFQTFFGTVVSQLERAVIMVDRDSLSRTVNLNGDQLGNGGQWNNSDGGITYTAMQLGSGSTAPQRSDIDIETPLIGAPQVSPFSTTGNVSAWDSLNGVMSTIGSVVTAAIGGAVNEACLFGFFGYLAPASTFFLLAHDTIPTVGFIAGQTLNCEYSFQL